MSVSAVTNGQRYRRTTGWDAAPTPVTVILHMRFNTVSAFATVWSGESGGGTFIPEIYLDLAPQLIGETQSVDTIIPSPTTAVWYFLATTLPSSAVGDPAIYYWSESATGAITQVTAAADFPGWAGDRMNFFEERNNGQVLNGLEVSAKMWTVLLTADQAANERFRMVPSTTAGLYAWLPLLNTAFGGADYGGVGNAFTVDGAPTTSRIMPAITWRGALDLQ